MKWRIVSFSEIEAPLVPFKPGYAVGIVEDENGVRDIAHIAGPFPPHIGLQGELIQIEGEHGAINMFLPERPQ